MGPKKKGGVHHLRTNFSIKAKSKKKRRGESSYFTFIESLTTLRKRKNTPGEKRRAAPLWKKRRFHFSVVGDFYDLMKEVT